ncbi:hypothetical protein GSI_10024 [Ganoderma sinense ZZ0214-1]|uniref:Uncharacterized protein n=1 Tax=Ganoderma sinense ZZ0214-1 TaxID=1077348 RepID=A0A2G8S2B8_9APHY|nr:hypothetical protein GSI_10024 [Ganoderma sinense ZZ0214-1]
MPAFPGSNLHPPAYPALARSPFHPMFPLTTQAFPSYGHVPDPDATRLASLPRPSPAFFTGAPLLHTSSREFILCATAHPETSTTWPSRFFAAVARPLDGAPGRRTVFERIARADVSGPIYAHSRPPCALTRTLSTSKFDCRSAAGRWCAPETNAGGLIEPDYQCALARPPPDHLRPPQARAVHDGTLLPGSSSSNAVLDGSTEGPAAQLSSSG